MSLFSNRGEIFWTVEVFRGQEYRRNRRFENDRNRRMEGQKNIRGCLKTNVKAGVHSLEADLEMV